VGNGFIGINALVELLAIEEVRNEFDDTRDTGRTAHHDDLVHIRFVKAGIRKDLPYGLNGAGEKIIAELFKAGTSERGAEVDAVEQ
jgi:hypothetical protein